jgi:2'-5' RNA ligase
MANLVIVAIPAEDDYVWKISSEKVPHMTICFLGDVEGKPILKIAEFLQHAVNILELGPFGADVDYRGTLGPDEADVLFFRKDWSLRRIAEFRSQLLKDTNIKTAYDSVEQYPEWQPHLTLGYPRTPAREDKRDYPGIHWVQFDRIALWYGDYEGPEFRLQHPDYDLMEVAMSAESATGLQFISHHGVKGMKWGVRKSRPLPSPVAAQAHAVVSSNKLSKSKIKVKGGENHPPSHDAIKAAVAKQKLKKSGPVALSNQELQELATRMNLEQQVARLAGSSSKSRGQKLVDDLLKDPHKTIDSASRAVTTGAKLVETANKLR